MKTKYFKGIFINSLRYVIRRSNTLFPKDSNESPLPRQQRLTTSQGYQYLFCFLTYVCLLQRKSQKHLVYILSKALKIKTSLVLKQMQYLFILMIVTNPVLEVLKLLSKFLKEKNRGRDINLLGEIMFCFVFFPPRKHCKIHCHLEVDG